MKHSLSLLVMIIALHCCPLPGFAQNNDDKTERAQLQLAGYLIWYAERDDFDTVYAHMDPAYLGKHKKQLTARLAGFYKEYKMLYPGTWRSYVIVWPEGLTTFRFRYFDSTGQALQLDFSFKKNDITSKVVLLETEGREQLKKEREASQHGGIRFEEDKPAKRKRP